MKYNYVGVNSMGTRITGETDAENESAVMAEMTQKGVTILEITKVKKKSLQVKRFRDKELANMMMQFAFMFEAGVQLTKAIDILSENASTYDEVKLVGMISDSIKGGSSVSEAFQACQSKFKCIKDSYIRQLEAGETGNFIDKSCRDIANSIYSSLETRGKIKSAMMYPIFIVILMIVVVVFMLVAIIPRMQSVFDELGGELPAITKTVVSASSAIQHYGIFVALIAVALIVTFKFIVAHSDKIKYSLDKMALRLPMLGKISHTGMVIEFCETMSTLLDKGIVAGEALKTSIGVINNKFMQDKLEYALSDVVNNGVSLSNALKNTGMFPNIIIQCIEVGEESSSIPGVLRTVIAQLKRELNDSIKALTTAIEPIMIVMIGLVVGVILLSIYLPLISMNDLF